MMFVDIAVFFLIVDVASSRDPLKLAVFLYGRLKESYYSNEDKTDFIHCYKNGYDTFLCKVANMLEKEFDWEEADIIKFMNCIEQLVPNYDKKKKKQEK